MELLTCNDLVLGYDNNVVVKDLNFSVTQGDYLYIVGDNGSGKSTLMKTILGLHTPLQGKIQYHTAMKANEIGYLPQQTVVQKDFPASVWEIVLSGCLNRCGLRPYYTKAQKQIAIDNLERLGITSLKKRCYRELSGGQQQRVLLARALGATGNMLLLDEPVSGLDPNATADMYQMIHTLNKQGITIIMISHDMEAALTYANRILQIGTPCFFGTRDAYVTEKRTTSHENGGGC